MKYPVDSELAGAYKGTMDVYYVGVSTPIASDMVQKVYISKASDTAVKLELKNFTITVAGSELLIGDITVDNCALTKSGDTYKFAGNQTLSLVVGSCNTSVSGTVGKNAVEMVIDVDVEGGMKVKVNYKGTKLSGSENSEAKITGFTIDNEVVTVAPIIDEEKSVITFKVNDEA
ncbi:MAG: calycin-like domain-containing protein, partial [Staphylococcus warneri]|nr:calycin-like domain-containing protein [Staphylococcus warneri]